MINTHYLRVKNSIISPIQLTVIFMLAALATGLLVGQPTANATLSGFSAGDIMGDEVMGNKGTMSKSQIQSFLKSKNSCNNSNLSWLDSKTATRGRWKDPKSGITYYYNLKDGHFVCMADDNFNGETASHIIYTAAQDYSINPQVIIVLLQKEQALITDTFPNHIQYRSATGYGCPDTAACDKQYYGLKNQVRRAASLFREVLNGGWSNYPVGNNYIQYNPDADCKGGTVNIKNRATSALYRYTPYQPNSGALAAGWGTANCGAYGNRNFYNYFTEWFGSTRYTIKGAIKRYYDSYGGKYELGKPIQNEVFAGNDTWYQCFQHGCIVGSSSTGFWESKGGVRDRWAELGYQNGSLGLPTGPEVYNSDLNSWSQTYQNGSIIGSAATGFWETEGPTQTRWKALGAESGVLGLPVAAVSMSAGDTSGWQQYQNGYIIGSSTTGYWESKGAIRTRWVQLGYQNSILGYPTGPEVYAGGNKYYQKFENGYIIGSGAIGFWENYGPIRSRWAALGYQNGVMGYPTGEVVLTAEGFYQKYQNGYIIGATDTGYWESKGAIRKEWAKLGYQNGSLGYPTGEESYNTQNKTYSQQFEHNKIFFQPPNKSWVGP